MSHIYLRPYSRYKQRMSNTDVRTTVTCPLDAVNASAELVSVLIKNKQHEAFVMVSPVEYEKGFTRAVI